MLKESFQLGYVTQDSYQRKSILREPGMFLQRHLAPNQNSGKKQKCAPHKRSPCAQKFEERSHEETLIQERCARKAAWDLAKNIYKLKNPVKTTLYTPSEARVMLAPTQKDQRSENS